MRFDQAATLQPVADLESLATHTPTWILVGSDDYCTKPMQDLLPTLQRSGTAELEIVDGVVLHGSASAIAQDTTRDAMHRWVRRSLKTAGSDA
jgi:hypothetical protein